MPTGFRSVLRSSLAAGLCIFLNGCSTAPRTADYLPEIGGGPSGHAIHIEYSFGVLPLHNAVRLFDMYEPLIDEINRNVHGFSVRLETAKDYPQYETKARDRRLCFVMMSSHLVIPTEDRGYKIIGRTANRVRGLVLVRKGSDIRSVRDLKFTSISFGARTDLASSMMPKTLLKQSGLDTDSDATSKYVGSPESVLMSVYFGRSAAGCVSESAWRSFQKARPEIAQSLQVRWQTDPLIGSGILARNDIPHPHVRAVAAVLFELNETPRGREILEAMKISGFKPATSESYDPMWEFLNDYKKLFGYLPTLGGAE